MMDSSDSEDDCYGNIAQKLQSMKNKYTEDKIDSTNLLNDSAEIDEIVKNATKSAKLSVPLSQTKQSEDDAVPNVSSEVTIDSIIASSSKRVTRSSVKRNSTEAINTESTAPKKSARKKSTAKSADASSVAVDQSVVEATENSQNNETVNTSRGRGGRNRGRGRGRSRNRNMRMWLPMSPYSDSYSNATVYSVGNTDEYPDQSDHQALFSTNAKTKSDDVFIIDDNVLDENEELSVKVYWQSSEFFKFTIRKFQKLSQIFDYFSKKENVSNDKLFFTFNDRILKPEDTPDSIDYNIVKFIDGGIVNQSVSNIISDKSKDIKGGIKLKFQCQNLKKPFEIMVSLDDKLSVAMMKCAENLDTTVEKLKFEFDGDSISGKVTARDLDLEGGECIDVRMIS